MSGKTTHDGIKRGNLFRTSPDRVLIANLDAEDDGVPADLLKVPIDPKRHKVDPGFAENIRRHGVIMPLVVRKLRDGRLFVTKGRRRLINARAAGAADVPYINEEDEDLLGSIAAENSWRMEDSLKVRGVLAQAMIEAGKPLADIANDFDVQPNTVRTWVTLLKATPAVMHAVTSGTLTESAAAPIAALPAEKQIDALNAALSEVAAAAAAGKPAKVTHARARAAANVAAGREENVGIRSRKDMKKIREYISGEGEEDAAGRRVLLGAAEMLTAILGDEKLPGDSLIKRYVREALKAPKKSAKKERAS